MVEKPAFATLLRASWGDATVLLVTLGLTLFRDLTEAIVVGFALGAVLFIHRMAQAVSVEERPRGPYHEEGADPEAVVFRVTGAMFFGAVSAVGAALDRIGNGHRLLVIDLSAVTLVDSSAANMIETLARKARRQGVALYVAGAPAPLRRELLAHGARPPLVRYAPSTAAALAGARRRGVLTAAG
jgi:SulP family sulfate permease